MFQLEGDMRDKRMLRETPRALTVIETSLASPPVS